LVNHITVIVYVIFFSAILSKII